MELKIKEKIYSPPLLILTWFFAASLLRRKIMYFFFYYVLLERNNILTHVLHQVMHLLLEGGLFQVYINCKMEETQTLQNNHHTSP